MHIVRFKGKKYRIIKRQGHRRAGYYRNGKYIPSVYVASTIYLKEL